MENTSKRRVGRTMKSNKSEEEGVDCKWTNEDRRKVGRSHGRTTLIVLFFLPEMQSDKAKQFVRLAAGTEQMFSYMSRGKK